MAIVFVTGSGGFIGSYVCRALVAAGHRPVGLVREIPTPSEHITGVTYVVGDVTDAASLRSVFPTDAASVVHLVGIIAENRRQNQTFERIHMGGTRAVVEAAQSAGLNQNPTARFLYVSAQGADPASASQYSQTKARAEQIVQASGLPFTILRPSLVIGPHGDFVRQMEQLIRRPPLSPFPLPFVPVPGSGKNRFQPVWVADLASAIVCSLDTDTARGQIIPVGGADTITFDTLLQGFLARLNTRKPLLHIPLPVMFAAAAVLEALLPRPPITRDQLINLRVDNITDNGLLRHLLNVEPIGWHEMLDRLPKA